MRDTNDSRTLPLLPQRAMTNAERQAAWRVRRAAERRYGGQLVVIAPSVVTAYLTESDVQASWVTRLEAGKLNPYQQHCFRVRYGCDLLREVTRRVHA